MTKSWLDPLFRPYLLDAYRIVRVQHGLPPDPEPNYRFTHVYTPHAGRPRPAPSSPDSPSTSPSAAPGSPWSIPPAPRVSGNVGHLSLFNQYMQQQCKSIEWVYADSAGEGTKTTPIWVVRAMVEDECLGRGRGSTKKAARNEAAKEGLVRLGIYVP